MERDNFNPGQLTGASQNPYPNSMPDGSGMGPEFITGDEHSAQILRNAESGSTAELRQAADQIRAREAARAGSSDVADLSPEQVAEVAELTKLLQNPDVTIKRLAEDRLKGIFNPRQQKQQRPQGQQAGGRPRNPEQEAPDAQQIQIFDADKYSDPEVKNMVVKLAFAKNNLIHDPVLIGEYNKAVQKIIDTSSGDKQRQATELSQELKLLEDAIGEQIKQSDFDSRDTFRLYLTTKDFDELSEDPMKWLEGQMNKIYNFSAEGMEQSSPLVQGAQQLHERALSWLTNTEYGRRNPKELNRFAEEFTNRLYTMFARSAVQQKNLEGIGGIAGTLGTHGIMNTLSFEGGLVNRMHNRINEIYDDTRITLANQHMTPVEHSKIQSRVIDEYAQLIMASGNQDLYAEIGLNPASIDMGVMSDSRMNTLAKENIRRAVRTAYDHFVASQREAVIVARGNALDNGVNLQGILADPSALFQMFNMEELLIDKFGTLNHEQQLFFNAIKRRYAESTLRKKGINFETWAQERIKIDPHIKQHEDEHVKGSDAKPDYTRAALEDYGSELMKDLMQVNDWYSSGWKLDEFMKQIDQNMQYRIAKQRNLTHISQLSEADRQQALDRAKEFGLFMRLRVLQNGTYYNTPGWKGMSQGDKDKYKDEERVKVWKQIARYKPEDVVRMFREHGDHHQHEIEAANRAFTEAGIKLTAADEANHLTLYDVFKRDYGASLRLIRELGYSGKDNRLPEQIDFSQIMSRPEYAKLLDNMLASKGPDQAQKIATLFGKLQQFAGNPDTIKKLMKDSRFAQVNLRTFTVDDGLLDRMEFEDLEMGLTALSKKLSPESGGDAYKRTFNDATAAAETHKSYITFLTAESEEEKLKAALAAAATVKAYRDPGVAALVFRHTFGSYKLMGTLTEKDKGVARTWYEMMDWKRKPNKGPVNELQEIFGPEAPAFNNDDMLLFLDHHKTDFVGSHGEELWEEMKELSRTRTKDRTRFQVYRGLLFFMLWIFFEGYNATTKTVGEGLKSEDV